MRQLVRFLFTVLSVCTGALFLYSAYTKLFPIQSFEYTIIEYLHIPSRIAGIAARILTGIEAGLGALIILHLYGKGKWVLKSAFILLVVFSLYLAWLWITEGNNVNCGCFGDAIWMSPVASLLKNAVLLLVIALLIRYHGGLDFLWEKIVIPSFLVAVMVTIFICFPFFTRYKIDLTAMYADSTNAPTTDLKIGKHIIAFLNPSCIHCRLAGLKIHDMEEKDSTLPIYLVIGGLTSDLKDFWKASNAQNIPHSRLDAAPFAKYTGGSTPTILWVNNGWVEANTNYTELNAVVIKKWMKQN